jgi:hypothetical protein
MKSKIKFYRRKLVIPTGDGEVVRYYSDLMYVKYEEPYNWLHFSCGAKYRVEVSVACLLENLPKNPFFRCNRTDIINLCYYAEYKESPSMVVLENGTEFKLSIRNITSFKKQKSELKRISPCPPCSDCKIESCPDFWLFCVSPGSKNGNGENGQDMMTSVQSIK